MTRLALPSRRPRRGRDPGGLRGCCWRLVAARLVVAPAGVSCGGSAGGSDAAVRRSPGLLEELTPELSGHRVAASGVGASTFAPMARLPSGTLGAVTVPVVPGSALAGKLDWARGCCDNHSARASEIDFLLIVPGCGGAEFAAAADGVGADFCGWACSVSSLSSRRYQH